MHNDWPFAKQTSVKKSYFMVLPLIVINGFSIKHKITLGQSSFEIPPEEILKRELILAFKDNHWSEIIKTEFYRYRHS